MKATTAAEVRRFQDIPNIGKAMEADLVLLGIKTPRGLIGKDPVKLYRALGQKLGQQDPCVLDTFMAAIDFMNGSSARPWWAYTEERKRLYPEI